MSKPTIFVADEEIIEVKPNSVLFNEGGGEQVVISAPYAAPSTMVFTVNGVSWRTDPITKRYVQMRGASGQGVPRVFEWDDETDQSELSVTPEPALPSKPCGGATS